VQKADSASIEQGCPAEWWIPTEQQERQGVNMKTSLLLTMVGVIIYFDHIRAWLEVSLSAPLPDKLPLKDSLVSAIVLLLKRLFLYCVPIWTKSPLLQNLDIDDLLDRT